MKKRVIHIISIVLLLSIFAVNFSGCSLLFAPVKHPEKGLIIESAPDYEYYIFYDKVTIIRYLNKRDPDKLLIRYTIDTKIYDIEDADFGDWIGRYGQTREILSGKFEKVDWYDDKLFILLDDIYYMLNINGFEIGMEPNEIELVKYTEKDLKNFYPQYEDFELLWEYKQ